MAAVYILILVSLFWVGGSSQEVGIKDCPSTDDKDVPLKFYIDTCYYLHLKEKKSFEKASKTCSDEGKRLIQPKSVSANYYLWFVINKVKQSSERVWVGALQDDQPGATTYYWLSGQAIETTTVNGFLSYGIAQKVPRRNGIWHFNLVSKDVTHAFVCEFKPGEDEIEEIATTPKPVPANPNPIQPPSSLVGKLCPNVVNSEANMKLFGNTCFYFELNSKATYQEAEGNCEKYGGNLAILKTKLRDRFIQYHLINSFGEKKSVWIGLRSKNDKSNSYVWEDGSAVTYQNFRSPQRKTGGMVMLYQVGYQWYDIAATVPLRLNYVCQFEAKIQS